MAAAAANSCSIWRSIRLKDNPQKCPKSCFEPSYGNCTDVKVLQVVNRESRIAQPVVEIELPARRRFDQLKECSKHVTATNDKCCNLCAVQNSSSSTNLCSSKCRPLSTMLRMKEVTMKFVHTFNNKTLTFHNPQLIAPVRPKPLYKHSVLLDDNTIVGRAFPIKFRIQRKACQCQSCKRDLCLRETVTSTENLILLSNCCNVEVYPRKKIDNWHLVPVCTITGKEVFAKKTVNEICKLEPKKIALPPPVCEKSKHKIVLPTLVKKKKKKKKASKKGKGKNKKKK